MSSLGTPHLGTLSISRARQFSGSPRPLRGVSQVARKPRKPTAEPKMDQIDQVVDPVTDSAIDLEIPPALGSKSDPKIAPIRIAARATRRRRTAAADAAKVPVVEAEIVDDDIPGGAPLAGLDEIGELPDGSARARVGEEAGERDPEAELEVGHQTAEDGADNDGGALVAVDPLGRYLAEIRRFPLLGREEEIEIAKRYAKDHD